MFCKKCCVKNILITLGLITFIKFVIDFDGHSNSFVDRKRIEKVESNCATEDTRQMTFFGQYDASGIYKTLSFIKKASTWAELSERPLCVAVQCTLNFANKIVEIVENWTGAVSFVIFTPGNEYFLALHYLKYLDACYPLFRQQVSVHVTYPMYDAPSRNGCLNCTMQIDCDLNAKDYLRKLLTLSTESLERMTTWEYPQNVLRNVAKDHCESEYVIVPDMDLLFPRRVPTSTIIEKLEAFLLMYKNSSRYYVKHAFIVPTFEIDDEFVAPQNKSELLRYLNEANARKYQENCQGCHNYTNYEKWEKLPPSCEVDIAYSISSTFSFDYEPFYIAKRGTVKFDERFVGYGMVRNSQVFEMKYAGYEFHVLDNMFLCHSGFPNTKYSLSRRRQTSKNYDIFCTSFLNELVTKYNIPSDRVPTCKRDLQKHVQHV